MVPDVAPRLGGPAQADGPGIILVAQRLLGLVIGAAGGVKEVPAGAFARRIGGSVGEPIAHSLQEVPRRSRGVGGLLGWRSLLVLFALVLFAPVLLAVRRR